MRLGQAEQQRIDAQEAAGYGGLTAHELLSKLPDGSVEKAALAPRISELEKLTAQVRDRNTESLSLAKGYLSMMEQILQHDTPSPTYGPKEKSEPGRSFGFTETI